MNPGGGGCSEPRSHHYTTAWATEQDSCLKIQEKSTHIKASTAGSATSGALRRLAHLGPHVQDRLLGIALASDLGGRKPMKVFNSTCRTRSRETESERDERDTESNRERETETDRQTDRQTERQGFHLGKSQGIYLQPCLKDQIGRASCRERV